MFEASGPVLLFDYFRVPYEIVPSETSGRDVAWVRKARTDRTLMWARPSADGPPPLLRLGEMLIPTHAVSDEAARALRGSGEWRVWRSLTSLAGSHVASIWRDDSGRFFLPFDPAQVIRDCWSERYKGADARSVAGRSKSSAMRIYYGIRPLLPRSVQISLRRRFTAIQRRRQFPRWPLETSLHDLYDLLFVLVAELAAEPVPRLAPWPAGYRWALVLTHDVETAEGRDRIKTLRKIERAAGLRSSWNLVPKRYEVPDSLVQGLLAEDCEIGIHGLYHDGRDLESRERLSQRLPEMLEYACRWSAVGFRSPATHRRWDLMPLLKFDYDSSYPDTDPFEPLAGGSCSWLPFFNEQLVELPITLPQDHTLFVILQQRGAGAWIEKTSYLRDRGGMALLITHPDYHLDGALGAAYSELISTFGSDETAWHALPRDIAAWWRRRAETSIHNRAGSWVPVGAAADEAVVELVDPAAVDHAEYL